MAQHHCPLLSLPTELRLLICAPLLTSPTHLTVYTLQTLTGQPLVYGAPFDREPAGSAPSKDTVEKRHPDILATCRQIYREAKSLLYKPHTLRLIPLPRHPHCLTLQFGKAGFDARNLRSQPPLRSLTVEIGATFSWLSNLPSNAGEAIAHSRFLSTHGCLGMEVDELKLDIDEDQEASHASNFKRLVERTEGNLFLARLWLRAVQAKRRSTVRLSGEWGSIAWQKEGEGEWNELVSKGYRRGWGWRSHALDESQCEKLTAIFKSLSMSFESQTVWEHGGRFTACDGWDNCDVIEQEELM